MLLPMTIKDIARLAGVSASTVSKVINGKDEHINPLTRSRVLEIVKEYNFTPYSTVKNISSTKKFLLGVLLHSVDQSDPEAYRPWAYKNCMYAQSGIPRTGQISPWFSEMSV